MALPELLHGFEKGGLSTWLRESPSVFGFYFILVFHTIGLSLLVGPNAVIDLRLLGFAEGIPLAPLKRWFAICWTGFAINAVSGVFLVMAYPVKALTNPVFYTKLILIGGAVYVMYLTKKRVFDDANLKAGVLATNAKTLALTSLVLWACAITCGRLLAYTCNYLIYGVPCE